MKKRSALCNFTGRSLNKGKHVIVADPCIVLIEFLLLRTSPSDTGPGAWKIQFAQ